MESKLKSTSTSTSISNQENDPISDSTSGNNSAIFIASNVSSSQFHVIGILIQIGLAIILAVTCKVPLCDVIFSVIYSLYLILANYFRFDSNRLARNAASPVLATTTTTKNKQGAINDISSMTTSSGNEKNKYDGDDDEDGNVARHEIDLNLIPDVEEPWFAAYMGCFAIVGLVLPLVTIIFGPEHVKLVTAPHLFVLWCQIIMETVALHSVYFHDLIRILVPIGFSAYRMKSLIIWCRMSLSMLAPFVSSSSLLSSTMHFFSILSEQNDKDNNISDNVITTTTIKWHHYWCAGLAIINLIMWSYNLFVFLLLRMTPYFLHPKRSPSPTVEWKGQLIPILKPLTSSSSCPSSVFPTENNKSSIDMKKDD